MAHIEINGWNLEFQPTANNYSKDIRNVGARRRTLSGALDVHSVAAKREWKITVPEQGLSVIPFGTPFPFKDFDGTTYQVMLTDNVFVRNRPEVSEIMLTLEEV